MSGGSFDPGFTTEAMARLWSNESRVEAMLRAEAALARAQAVCGVIPRTAADAIGQACEDLVVDADALLAEGWEVGTPVSVLLDRLRGRMDHDSAASLHVGATTQDIVDTAAVLQIDASLTVTAGDLIVFGDDLARLAGEHRGTVTIGRTFRQHAFPTTFGLRCAQWLASVSADLAGIRDARSTLPVQLGGAVGNGVGLGPDPVAVLEAFAADLSLCAPVLAWHSDRTPIRRAVSAMHAVAVTAAKVANDLIDLAQTEVGEVSVRAGGSSAVPGKQNPIDAIRAVAAERVCAAVTTVLGPHSLDRAAGPWHAEWLALPVVFQTAAAALEAAMRAIATLRVDIEAMARRVEGRVDPAVLKSAGTFVDRAIGGWEAERG
jgi:3-carboxy-cis,cis-muconate cycloisomerase